MFHSTSLEILQVTVEGFRNNRCHKPVVGRLPVSYGGQFQLSGRPHNPTPRFRPSHFTGVSGHCWIVLERVRATAVSQEMGFHWQRTMCLWWNPNNVIQIANPLNSCPLTKFDGRLLHLHETDEAAINWVTTYYYGSWHTTTTSSVVLPMTEYQCYYHGLEAQGQGLKVKDLPVHVWSGSDTKTRTSKLSLEDKDYLSKR